ncbi:hypothetical protein ACFL0W_05060 [Nanoarchaeota archaeon]
MQQKNENTQDIQSGSGNRPEKEFRAGAVRATIWKNIGHNKAGEATEYNTIGFQRSYQDKEGVWQTTSSLRINDLPKAQLVLKKAYEYIVLKDKSDTQSYFPEDLA